MFWSLSWKYANITKLLATVFILLVCKVFINSGQEFVRYEGVLKSRVHEIQTDITRIYKGGTSRLQCDHQLVLTDNSTIIVIFVWASEEETYAMRSCFQLGIERARMKIMRILQSSNLLQSLQLSVRFCKRSIIGELKSRQISNEKKMDNKTMLVILDLYVTNFIEFIRPPCAAFFGVSYECMWSNEDGILTVTSSIVVNLLPTTKVKSYVQTFVCNSIQLTVNETGKLRQRFFSFLENSVNSEFLVSATETGRVRATLDFDVLTLNGSRSGLLNDSNVELMSLSDLQVSCVKFLESGLTDETNETTDINWMKESQSTEALIIHDKLRLRVNMNILVVSEYGTRIYACTTHCKLRTTKNDTIDGCSQKKYFSIAFDEWRDEHFIFKQTNKYCKNIILYSEERCQMEMKNISERWKTTANLYAEGYNNSINDTYYCIDVALQIKSRLISWQMISIVLSVIIIVTVAPLIFYAYKITKKFLQYQCDMEAFTSMGSVLQSMENREERIMKYDVFLSYSSKDKTWVRSALLQFIESKGFKVCFDERDFPYGCNLLQAIVSAVYESRKVIAVVSPNYLKSAWCAKYEFVLTYTKILNKEAPFDSLLLIKYGDCKMPPHMRILKYLDHTKTTNAEKRHSAANVLHSLFPFNVLPFLFPFCKVHNVDETNSEEQLFDDLISWLGQPLIAEQ